MTDVVDKDTGYKQALAAITELAAGDPHVTIGVHGKDNDPYRRGQGAPVTTAQIATFHEFGTLDRFEDPSPAGDGRQGVPQRSFLRSTADEKRREYSALIARGIGRVIDGTMALDRALGIVGAKAVGDVQNKIASGIEPPLTEETIERKGSSKPLIDTGQLRQAIDWETHT